MAKLCPHSAKERDICILSPRGEALLGAVESALKNGKAKELFSWIEEKVNKKVLVSPDLLRKDEEEVLAEALAGLLFYADRFASLSVDAILVGHGEGNGAIAHEWFVGDYSVQEWMEMYSIHSLHVIACENGLERTAGGFSGRVHTCA